MTVLVLIILACISSVFIATILIWNRVNLSWLHTIAGLMFLSLPFERIPSVQVGGANIRISQILAIICVYIVAVLILKKDNALLTLTIPRLLYVLGGFVLVSTISWFMVIDFRRFMVTEVGTILCFITFAVLSLFLQSVFEWIRKLIIIMFGVGLFGVYQFVGDIFSIPNELTGLREHYTRIVFGIPRIHATALEPLYFAGMLFLPIFGTYFLYITKRPLFPSSSMAFMRNYKLNAYLCSFFVVLCIMTLSKSAWLGLGISTVIVVVYSLFRFASQKIVTYAGTGVAVVMGLIAIIANINAQFGLIIQNITSNIIGTFSGESATAMQRNSFLDVALELLNKQPVVGIGSGQYGVFARDYLPQLAGGVDNYLIVNNVYLEVWLEHGILAAILFVLFFAILILRGLTIMIKSRGNIDDNQLSIIVLTCTLIAYVVQWSTFSPIFIMPIFLVAGALYRSLLLQHVRSPSE